MSDSNRTKLSFVEEATWGTTPASALQILRWTGESLKYNIGSAQSSEIRSDRNISELFLNDASVTGGFNFELSYGTYDDLFEGALWSSWGSATTGTGSGYTVNYASGYSVGDTDIAIDTGSGTVLAGDVITFAGDDSKYIVKTGVTAPGTITLFPPGLKASLADNTAMTIGSRSVLVNGTTEKSYTIEREHSDMTQFFAFTGCIVNQFSLNVAAGAPITGSFDFLGKTCTRCGSTVGTGTAGAATTTDVMTGITIVGTRLENDAALTGIVVKSFSMNVNNNVRALSGIGDIGAADMGVGSCVVTGSLEMLFKNGTIYDKIVANTATKLSIRLNDNDSALDGNDYIFDFPNVKYSDSTVNAGGLDSDVPITFNWQALYDSSTGGCLKITKIAE